jgi:hypothetical protein
VRSRRRASRSAVHTSGELRIGKSSPDWKGSVEGESKEGPMAVFQETWWGGRDW